MIRGKLKGMELRLERLAILLACLVSVAAFADNSPEAGSLSDRIAEIEHAHMHQPWPVSQQMIDALRPALADASIEQRARVEIMQARNLGLDGRYETALGLLDEVLVKPVSAVRRLRALELSINTNYLIQDYERAFDLLAGALSLFPDVEDARQKADVLTLVSRLYSDVGEHGLALETRPKAWTWPREPGTPGQSTTRFTR